MSKSASKDLERSSDDRSLWAAGMGLVGLIVVLLVVAVRWHDASGVAALGAVASAIAAIVSGYYGLQSRQCRHKHRRSR